MKHKWIGFIGFVAACLFTPCFLTAIISGNTYQETEQNSTVSTSSPYEDLVSRMAVYYESGDPEEYAKMLAVLIRTNEACADPVTLKELSRKEMEQKYGDSYDVCLAVLSAAAATTDGIVMTCDGAVILPYFFAVSAGSSRVGDLEETYPYLKSVDCSADRTAPEYLSEVVFSSEKLERLLTAAYPSIQFQTEIGSSFQIISKDAQGYVTEIMVGSITTSGDAIASILSLNSADFSISSDGAGSVIFTVKGVGDGYGVSLYGAKLLADSGYDYEQLLCYYYKNIQFTSV